MGRFVYVEDATEPPKPARIELFAGVKDLNNVNECAEVFGVHPMTVRRLIQRGELECVHIGKSVRITRQQMIEFIESQGVQT